MWVIPTLAEGSTQIVGVAVSPSVPSPPVANVKTPRFGWRRFGVSSSGTTRETREENEPFIELFLVEVVRGPPGADLSLLCRDVNLFS